jgi:predicted nucleic acid-binding protein
MLLTDSLVPIIVQRGLTVKSCTGLVRDPKDDKFLQVAVAGKADVIVSGDEDLLVLHPFSGIPILRPAAFLRMLDAPKP